MTAAEWIVRGVAALAVWVALAAVTGLWIGRVVKRRDRQVPTDDDANDVEEPCDAGRDAQMARDLSWLEHHHWGRL